MSTTSNSVSLGESEKVAPLIWHLSWVLKEIPCQGCVGTSVPGRGNSMWKGMEAYFVQKKGNSLILRMSFCLGRSWSSSLLTLLDGVVWGCHWDSFSSPHLPARRSSFLSHVLGSLLRRRSWGTLTNSASWHPFTSMSIGFYLAPSSLSNPFVLNCPQRFSCSMGGP